MENTNPWLEITKQKDDIVAWTSVRDELLKYPVTPNDCISELEDYYNAQEIIDAFYDDDEEEFLEFLYNEFDLGTYHALHVWKYLSSYNDRDNTCDGTELATFMYEEGYWS